MSTHGVELAVKLALKYLFGLSKGVGIAVKVTVRLIQLAWLYD